VSIRLELTRRFAVRTALAPLPLLAFALGGRLSRLEGALLIIWFVAALIGLARSGRALLTGEDDEHGRHPLTRLVVGLGVLPGSGWLLGAGLRAVVRHLGISQTR
jgi:hypothetical protein